MSAGTAIEWTEATWNPVTGCDQVSPGCDNCYALTLARRLKAMRNPRYQSDGARRTSGPGFGVTLHHDQVTLPLRWKKSRLVFVNSMSDLFHPDVPEGFIKDVFLTMNEARQHTFQVLTKRPRRMAHLVQKFVNELGGPSPNVWLGTSVENQEWAEKRVPLLLETPAKVRFLSLEPLLGPVDLEPWLSAAPVSGDDDSRRPMHLDWVIVGGESGHRHRRIDLDWVALCP